jgi:two-component system, NarL family, sensor kinase
MGPEAPERIELEHRLDDLMQQHRDLVDRLSQGQQYFRRLARSVWRVQEEERRRLARDLHDGIGQNLTVLVHLVDNALNAAGPSPSDLRAGLEKARALVMTTIDETRALSRLLRPQILDDLGLEAALRWLTRTYAESNGLNVSLQVPPEIPVMDNDQATLIFRVVQEALTNAARHSKASKDDEMRVIVRDNGTGCDLKEVFAKGSEGKSAGIGGMRDRVRLFSGDLKLESQRGAGFCVTISFPMRTNGVSK